VTIIALHGDFATPTMLQRDMGDLSELVDIFFDARKWLRFDAAMGRLTSLVQSLSEPPIVIGYSRGGSAIARLSELVELRAAVVYESPVIDSEGVGGSFPVLVIWNDCGAKIKRPGQARVAEEICFSPRKSRLKATTQISPAKHVRQCHNSQQSRGCMRSKCCITMRLLEA